MTTEDRGRRARLGPAAICAAALVVVVACGDPYLHTNPYDALTPLQATIIGPDSLFSVGQVAHYSLKSTPAFSDTSGQWNSSDSTTVIPAAYGDFQVYHPPLEPEVATVQLSDFLAAFDTAGSVAGTVSVNWRHAVYRTVVVMQRLVTITLRCPAAHVCVPLAAGDTTSIWIDGFDALGSPVIGLVFPTANRFSGTPIAVFVSRDTTVVGVSPPVGIREVVVTARAPGTAWIVATRGALRDSVQVVVH
jgi:hypothetical protein